VDQPLGLFYALAAFIRQEASLSWTVNAYLTILPEASQKIVQNINPDFTQTEHELQTDGS